MGEVSPHSADLAASWFAQLRMAGLANDFHDRLQKAGGKGGEGVKKTKAGGEGEKKKDGEVGMKKDKGGEKKKDDVPLTIVLKVDMHCEGCARKAKHSVARFEGVERVTADCSNNKLMVVGKVDPCKLREHVESKIHKQVVLVSPANLPKKGAAAAVEEKKNNPEEKKTEEKKPKEPAASTVTLKISLHCEGCIGKVRRTVAKVKGVDKVFIDPKEDLVMVKGTMDVKALLDYVSRKLRQNVAVVPSKDGGGGKDKGDKKKSGGSDGGAEKKGKEGGSECDKKKGGDGGAKVVPLPMPVPLPEVSRIDYNMYGGFGAYPPYGYRYDIVHAPQLFSDENPHACVVM